MANDSAIMYIVVVFFVSLGVLMPHIELAFGSGDVGANDLGDLTKTVPIESDINASGSDIPCIPIFIAGTWRIICNSPEESVNGLDIITSVGKMFFWTFGSIPFFVDLILMLPLRILLAFLIYRAIRSGAG